MIFKILLSRSVQTPNGDKNWQTSCPLQTFVCNISRHLQFIIELGHRVNWVSGSLDSRVTGSLGHKMWPSSISDVHAMRRKKRITSRGYIQRGIRYAYGSRDGRGGHVTGCCCLAAVHGRALLGGGRRRATSRRAVCSVQRVVARRRTVRPRHAPWWPRPLPAWRLRHRMEHVRLVHGTRFSRLIVSPPALRQAQAGELGLCFAGVLTETF